MEFKGTKGEWEVDNQPSGVFSTDKNIEGDIICFAPELFDDSLKNWEANAQLIATAPELLKALQDLYNSIDSCIDLTPELMQSTLKTINKALGK